MNSIIERLVAESVDVTSVFGASRYANTFSGKLWSKSRYETIINDIFNVEASTAFDKEAEMLFRYMVMIAVEQHVQNNTTFTGVAIYDIAKDRVAKFFKNFPWNHPSHNSQLAKSDFDEEGNYIGKIISFDVSVPEDIEVKRTVLNGKTVKPKKGLKQLAAKAIFDANVGKSNQEIIKLFMSQLDMSKAGATTYLYNMKKTLAK